MYSTIIRKKCKCGCGRFPTVSCGGYYYGCMPDELKEKIGSKKKLQVKKNNAAKYAATKLRMSKYSEDKELEFWFNLIRSKMSGECECGCRQPTSKYSDKFFKFSACHLLPKSKFKSVATHPMNYLELTAFGNSCHTTFDNMGYEYCKKTKPVLWKIVVERFNIIYPSISISERKFIPQVLLNELKNTND